MKQITNIEKKTFEDLAVEIGIVSGNLAINTQSDLEKYYNTRDKELYTEILKSNSKLILRYSNGENVIKLDKDYLDEVEKVTNKPVMLEKNGERYGRYDAVIIPNYLKERRDMTIGSFARDCAVIVVIEENTDTVAFIHAGRKPLLSGIVTRAMNELKEVLKEEKELNFRAMIMPHIKRLELGPEIYPKVFSYKIKYLKYVNMEFILDNETARNNKIYLYPTRAIISELIKFMPNGNIHFIEGDTRDRRENGELIFGSFRESKKARMELIEDKYSSIQEEEIIISNIVKNNMIYIKCLN